ncbi:hypothetical protein BV25DRAFT_312510 [Artomyces pyxidatus]|uniref:Uncharacterized protein n=1 Tax=Artomyces pyxidatus TaxID=48021 RepID=A0ACB8T8L7_9AGAM|nr:hypothetical protein BV25DRAFT_312510 [Artomyces pyxidatus]
MWNYVAGSKRLPVQWVSWLSHTRPDAPTLEELRADLERQRRILHNAALIEARDREEQTRVVAAPQSDPLSDISTTLHPPTIHEKELKLLEAEAEEQKRSDLQLKTKDTDLSGAAVRESNLPLRTRDTDWQPEAWAPQASRQRGG